MSTATGATLRGARIAVVNWRDLDHSLAGGSEIYAWQFARALRDAGARVDFVTSRDDGQTRREVREGIVIHRGGGALGFYRFALGWLLRRRGRLDAVIDPAGGLPSFSPLVLRRRTPVALIVHHVHQAQFGVHFPAPVAAFGRWAERDAMRRAYRPHTTVAVSPSTAAEMRRQLGWTGDIRILENGADVPRPDLVDARAKDCDRIVVLGRLVTHKRVDLVLDAVDRIRTHTALTGRTLHVDVIGQGPQLDQLRDHASSLGLGDQVTFHGYLPVAQKDALLAAASVQVCASDAEGWGQAVIDAAAWGVPTVARDVPGLRDSIRPGETGWLVPDDADHAVVTSRLAAALVDALVDAADTERRILRAEACRAWAHKFDWSQMRAEASALTADLLHGPASAGSVRHQPRHLRAAV